MLKSYQYLKTEDTISSELEKLTFTQEKVQKYILTASKINLSRDMTKPTKWLCAQRRLIEGNFR